MRPEHQNAEQESRRAVSTGPSLLLALVFLASMSGTLGAPRSICLAATTLSQTACTLQVTFRALASSERRDGSVVRDRGYAPAPRETVTPALDAVLNHASLGHVRVACDLPPPRLG